MKRIFFLLLTGWTAAFAQEGIRVELTESYELSNIILALTQYGRTDKWDVQKVPPYYEEVLAYFAPVKNHPLLDSVNYSRKAWEKFLGFRTDMYAFSFDRAGRLKRDYPFSSFGPREVDKHLDLINDFVAKSNYRKFYADHLAFYRQIISNYKGYYLLRQSKAFLDKVAQRPRSAVQKKYVIAISPLVGGQNCHRDVDSLTTVDFPNISADLIVGNLAVNLGQRVQDNHSIFTEMDHGYVNPISDKYAALIAVDFDLTRWDKASGYPGISSFNEYMTWAVYDLFVKENFPALADSICLQWQYANAARGFIAQNLFSKKLADLYFANKGKTKIERLYEPLLKWCKEVGSTVSQPTLLNASGQNFVKIDSSTVHLEFSEPMDPRGVFSVKTIEVKDGKQTGKEGRTNVHNPWWSADGKSLRFKMETPFEAFAIVFNWWGIDKPLVSKRGVLLKPQSFVLLKK